MNMFRTLRADEIDCRVAQIKKDGSGLSLLLYKDARCDQNILDETVGPMNWERKHSRENANCTVSIWCDERQCWVSKEDTGTESNTEKEKGLASDSFKRACFNWGIGRELYTAPFIWIKGEDCNIKKETFNGRETVKCNDRFTVHGIGYTDGVITGLEIKNQKTSKICFRYGVINETAPEKPENPEDEAEEKEIRQDAPADVKTTDKVPPTSGAEYMKDIINSVKEKKKIKTYAEAKGLVLVWTESLIKSGAVEPIDLAKVTVDEAVNLENAIKDTFLDGEKK